MIRLHGMRPLSLRQKLRANDCFRGSDHPGVIASRLESKLRVRSLLRVVRLGEG